jgi:hypothetical protein
MARASAGPPQNHENVIAALAEIARPVMTSLPVYINIRTLPSGLKIVPGNATGFSAIDEAVVDDDEPPQRFM